MAYRLAGITKSPEEWGSLLTGALSCYDTLGDDDCKMDRDELLHERSALEFVRDELTDAQRGELDQVDAFWRAHADAFNSDFAVWHHQGDRGAELRGFVVTDAGEVPEIPRSHWWWRPLEA